MRRAAAVLGLLVLFDVLGVVLTVVADLLGLVHRVLETSSPLGFAIWFVTGVFCSLAIYGVAGGMDGSEQARQRGSEAWVVTAVCALGVGAASSLLWADGTDAAVVPDSAPLTITYLATVVAGVAWWRIGVFSGEEAGPAQYVVSYVRPVASVRPATPEPDASEGFRPAGALGTLGWMLGMPVLLFLVASFFILAPFHGLMRPWTDPILTGALVVGPVWGFLAARWEIPREAVLAVHAPLLVGSVSWFLAALVASPLVGLLGLPDRVASAACAVVFFAGFLLGLGALVGWVAEAVAHRRAVGQPGV